MRQGFLPFHSLATSTTNGFKLYRFVIDAYVEIHQVRRLVFDNDQRCAVPLKEHVALDRTSWSIKSVCNSFLQNAYTCSWKDVLKVEYNYPHKFASKSRGFPFTVLTNTVGHLWESKNK